MGELAPDGDSGWRKMEQRREADECETHSSEEVRAKTSAELNASGERHLLSVGFGKRGYSAGVWRSQCQTMELTDTAAMLKDVLGAGTGRAWLTSRRCPPTSLSSLPTSPPVRDNDDGHFKAYVLHEYAYFTQ